MNNNLIKNVLIFAVGAAAGSAVTWKLLKTKYEQIAQEEIDSVKETFSRRYECKEVSEEDEISEDIEVEEEDEEIEIDPEEVKKVDDMISDLNYRSYSNKKKKKKKKEEPKEDDDIVAYVISPDDFGSDDYETVDLTYYADDILADDDDNIIEDRELLIGNYALDSFGEYEEDIVHVRNEETKCDYEICRVNERYTDMV